MVQWLGFGAFIAVAGVQFLVEELRSHKPCSTAKKKKKKKKIGAPKSNYEGKSYL